MALTRVAEGWSADHTRLLFVLFAKNYLIETIHKFVHNISFVGNNEKSHHLLHINCKAIPVKLYKKASEFDEIPE